MNDASVTPMVFIDSGAACKMKAPLRNIKPDEVANDFENEPA
jgi:hypothetical protein